MMLWVHTVIFALFLHSVFYPKILQIIYICFGSLAYYVFCFVITIYNNLNFYLSFKGYFRRGALLKLRQILHSAFCYLFLFLFNFGASILKRFSCFSSYFYSSDRFKKSLPNPLETSLRCNTFFVLSVYLILKLFLICHILWVYMFSFLGSFSCF